MAMWLDYKPTRYEGKGYLAKTYHPIMLYIRKILYNDQRHGSKESSRVELCTYDETAEGWLKYSVSKEFIKYGKIHSSFS